MVELDGAYGEGGGQILRTGLALASILKVPVRVVNIRANRKNPGLKPQHVMCVQALAALTNASVVGGKINSMEVVFEPKTLRSGEFSFNVADLKSSAGSVTLILQALLPPLLYGPERSRVMIRGGTHVEWSPPVHYLLHVFLPTVLKMGAHGSMNLTRWGWYPKGKGTVTIDVEPLQELIPVHLEQRGALEALRGLSVSSKLPMMISKRQRRKGDQLLREAGYDAQIRMFETPASCPGTIFFLWAEFENSRAGFSTLGRRGRPAEEVAGSTVRQFLEFMDSGAAVDEHLADQLVIYMALAQGQSSIVTSRITQHLLTCIWVVEQFLPVKFEVEGSEGEGGKVTRIT
ncbi:MAG: RNA 3'-phosphate cyclase [Gemmatimonadota bacterium]|nr:MAG: RNA 3'-phosphate cyclase [Gemmatimonadota bacterium]